MMPWAVAAWGAGLSVAVDLSALAPMHHTQPIATAGAALCASGSPAPALLDGAPAHALAVAGVVVSRKAGRSAWGHARVRVLACQRGALRDLTYEVYRFNQTTAGWLTARSGPAPALTDPDWVRHQRGSLVWLRTSAPVDGGQFAADAHANRELYEVWLPNADANQALTTLDRAWQDQRARIAEGRDLPQRYRLPSQNCTTPLQAAFGGDRARPHAWLNDWATAGHDVVLYPSHSVLRRIVRRVGGAQPLADALSATGTLSIRRPRPIVRGGRALPAGTTAWLAPAATAHPPRALAQLAEIRRGSTDDPVVAPIGGPP
jgi:hypothetical protein